MHAIHYNPVRTRSSCRNVWPGDHDVPRGDSGEEPPVRSSRGPPQLRGSSGVVLDVGNNELITERKVFPVDANGNVAPIRTLRSMCWPWTRSMIFTSVSLGGGGDEGGGEEASPSSTAKLPATAPTPADHHRTKTSSSDPEDASSQWRVIAANDGAQSARRNGLSFLGSGASTTTVTCRRAGPSAGLKG